MKFICQSFLLPLLCDFKFIVGSTRVCLPQVNRVRKLANNSTSSCRNVIVSLSDSLDQIEDLKCNVRNVGAIVTTLPEKYDLVPQKQ